MLAMMKVPPFFVRIGNYEEEMFAVKIRWNRHEKGVPEFHGDASVNA
jgi:hypothetical protein